MAREAPRAGYTRVAIAQLPHDLVEQHVPASVQHLDLAVETADPRARQLLDELRKKLDELQADVWQAAEAQAFSHAESVLRFCGEAGRQVDILVFPDALPYSWLPRIDHLRLTQNIPAVVAGSHVLRGTAVQLGPTGNFPIPSSRSWQWEVPVSARGQRVMLRVRRWNEIFLELARPPLASKRVLFAVPSAPSADDALQLDSRTDELQRRFGVAIAFANADGRSRFFARALNGDGLSETPSDELPIGSLLYRVPPGDSAVAISDLDLLQQRQDSVTQALPVRAVTVAPLIAEDDFPEYSRFLREMRESDGAVELWVLSRRARQVRRRTLERLNGKSKARYRTLQMKLTELESSGGRAEGLGWLGRHADPADTERLVDAVVLPSTANRIWWLLESIRLSLGLLAERLPPRDSLWITRNLERIDSLSAHYSGAEELVGDPPPDMPHERKIDLVELASTLIQIELHSKELSRDGSHAFDAGDDLWGSIDVIVGRLKESFEIPVPPMNRLRTLAMRSESDHRSPREIPERADSGFEVPSKQPIAELLVSILTNEKAERAEGGMLVGGTSENEGEEKLLQAVDGLGSELALETRRLQRQLALARQHGELLALRVSYLSPSETLLLTRRLVGTRGLVVYLVSQDDPEAILRGLLLELSVLYRLLRLVYPEMLRELARLTPEQRRSRMAARQDEIRSDGSQLASALERLLSNPQQHWQEAPGVCRHMRSLLEAKQEVSILALLGMLAD